MLRKHWKLNGPLTIAASLMGLLGLGLIGQFHKSELLELWPLAWLLPLALYDLQKREVPHMAFVAIPCALAMLSAVLGGDWTLGLLALLVVAVSERRHLPTPLGTMVLVLSGLSGALLLTLTPFEQAPGAIAVLGFWLAYELGWWAGADALVAITLALVWPELKLLVSLAAAHLVLALVVYRGRILMFPRRLSADELAQVGVAGLPALALSAALFTLWHGWLP
jgi:hypothetical protein